MDVLGVIPARAGSKGIPGKNLAELAGKPLLAHQIEHSRETSAIDRTIVSTDGDEIAQIARECGAEIPFRRPASLADDDTSVIAAYKHALEFFCDEGTPPRYVVGLQPTCPFTKPGSIERAVERIRETGADAVVGVTEVDPEQHPYRVYTLQGDRLRPFDDVTVDEPIQRQDLPAAYRLTGGIFVRHRSVLQEWRGDSFGLGGDTRVVRQGQREAIDIDTPFELRLARALCHYEASTTDDH